MEIKYAGFWIRFVAYIIDKIIISIIQSVLIIPITVAFGLLSPFWNHADNFPQYTSVGFVSTNDFGDFSTMGFWMLLLMLIFFLQAVGWLYYSLLESSSKQATLGKAALGLKVVGKNYNRITFLRATARYFSKIISSLMLMFGFIIAGFTPKKQALHDFIAETFVIYSD